MIRRLLIRERVRKKKRAYTHSKKQRYWSGEQIQVQ